MAFDPNKTLYPFLPLALIFAVAPAYLIFNFQSLTSLDLFILLFCFFLFDNMGVQIGVHKHLCHRSFGTHTFWRRGLSLLSVLSGQGSPLVWVAVHMGSHHPHYESEKDIHTPVKGLWFAFLAWYWRCDKSLINMGVAREYMRDKFLVFLHRHHTLILLFWWVILSLTGGWKLLVLAGLAPAGLSVIMAGFVNSFMHSRGTISRLLFQKYQNHPGDSTYNSLWLGMMTMGLGLHNNHHHEPSRTIYSQRWYEWDPSRMIISLIRKE